MNSKSKHKNNQQNLSHWLKGDATRKDELHLEEMGQEDTFLAEALEGYRTLPEENHLRKITQIKANLRQKKQRRGLAVWMKLAAIGAFLVLALWGMQEYNQTVGTSQGISENNKSTPPSMTATYPENNVVVEEKTTTEKEESIEVLRNQAKSKSAAKEKLEIKEKDKPTSSKNQLPEEYTSTQNANTTADKDMITVTVNDEAAFAMSADEVSANQSSAPATTSGAPKLFLEKPAPSPLNEEAFDKAVKPVILNKTSENDDVLAEGEAIIEEKIEESSTYIGRVVKGKVLSDRGEPLRGANVIISGTPAGTTTDFDGDFAINVPVDNASLDISYLGYQDLRIDLQHQNDLQISMEEDKMELEEAMIASKRSAVKKSRSQKFDAAPTAPRKDAKIKKAAPKIGQSKFEKYLLQNLKYPPRAKKQKITGAVIVEFKVQKNGTLSDFKVLKSLGFGCDEEAIRLLQEGPEWETDIDTVTTYEIWFE